MTEETTTKPRLNLQEIRSQDLVSRLLAATPPYLYSAPGGPHSFFFSEMLRSLVQAKTNNDAAALRNNIQQQQQAQQAQATQIPHHNVLRRPRKRQWSHQRLPIFDPPKKMNDEEKEKPLELTKKHSAFSSPKPPSDDGEEIKVSSPSIESSMKYQKLDDDVKLATPDAQITSHTSCDVPISPVTSSSSTPSTRSSSDIVLPPPPPMWYPPLYPPYGIDPLHFFIDLRVSGHIYDRKKENQSPTYRPDNNTATPLSKARINSAFSVPVPKDHSAINLSSPQQPPSSTATSTSSSGSPLTHSQFQHKFESNDFDYYDTKENSKNARNNTNYVMQNLPRIYTNLSNHGGKPDGIDMATPKITDDHQSNCEKLERKYFSIHQLQQQQHNQKLAEAADNNNSSSASPPQLLSEMFSIKKFENENYKKENDEDETITIEEID